MTEEQLNKEAEEYQNVKESEQIFAAYSRSSAIAAFKAGYRSRDKEVEDLRKVLESVKDACDWIHLPDWLEQEVKQALKIPPEGR